MAMGGTKACVVLLCLCAGVLDVVKAYSAGPPVGACKAMMPSHDVQAQTGPIPYEITVSKNTYSAGEKITVTLRTPCGRPFVGFMLQARNAEDPRPATQVLIGSFTTKDQTKFLSTGDCGSGTQTIVHNSNDPKQNFEIEWTAPASPDKHVVFIATIVEGYSVFWMNVYSEVVELTGSASAPSATAVGLRTTKNCTAMELGRFPKDTQCGQSKSCYSDCDDSGCSFLMSWNANGGNDLDIEMKSAFTDSDSKWIALGFSNDDKMGDDTVVECAVNGQMKSANHSLNQGRSNTRQGAIEYTQIEFVDDILSCQIKVPESSGLFSIGTRYTLLFAVGSTRTGSTEKAKHATNPAPFVSGETADLSSTTQDISASAASNILVKAHGSLMITAWVFLASFGLVVARYYKKLGGTRRWCSLHIWFQIHRLFMIITFVLAAAAFIIIFVDVRGYSQVGMSVGDLTFLKAHPILGIISTALVVLNPLMALLRPHPDSSRRPIFNWAHWFVGTSAWIISIVAIFIGFEIPKSAVHPKTIYIMAAFVAYQLLVELILEIHGCMQRPQQKSGQDEYELHATNGKPPSSPAVKKGSSGAGVFRSVVLVMHLVILFSFLVAILVFVNYDRVQNYI